MFMAPLTKKQKNNSFDVSDPMRPGLFYITQVQQDTYDTFTLGLTSSEKGNGFHFAPGQFNMLYVFGIGEVPISISGDPTAPNTLVHTTRAVGTVTRAMKKLKKGEALGVRGPFGTSWPVGEAEGNDVIIVAGGIGLAPLRPVIYYALANRHKYGKVILLYGARTPEDVLYARQLELWRARPDIEVMTTVDRGTGDWKGNVGVVTTLIPKATFDINSSVAMVCGPEIMMRYTIMELQRKGLADAQIHVSMERNMKCGVGLCGHCQLGPTFICKNGPVYRFDLIKDLLTKREL
jgi:NAD(P)H-flavin reductase